MKLIFRTLLICLLQVWISCSPVIAEDSLTILSQNMNRLFDDIDDGNRAKVVSPERYQQRIKLAADRIYKDFGAPHIVALQEVENINVLKDIAGLISVSGGPKYQPVLLEGNDVSGIDVGYLVRSGLRIGEQKQLFKNSRLDSSPLFSRPPLLIQVCTNHCLTLINIHLRSMRDLRSVKKSKRVAKKRRTQASHLAKWINQFQIRQPQISIMVLGDFNALRPADSYSDIVGTIMGSPDNSIARYPTKDWIKRDMIDLTRQIPKPSRYSYIFKGKHQVLDYMLVSQSFEPRIKRILYSDILRDFSDHAGMLTELSW